MRLSFILSSMWLSGGVRVVVEYANRLAHRGHIVTLVVPAATQDPDIFDELVDAVDVRVSSVPRTAHMNGVQLLHLTWSLARSVPPSDIVLSTHTPTTAATFIATQILRQGRPVWLYQDYREMFIGRPIETWLLKNAMRWHDRALAVSTYAQEELLTYASGNVVVVGEGLSHADIFSPQEDVCSGDAGPQRILFLGDMRPRKGLFDFLEAAELLYTRLPSIELLIVSKEECDIETAVPFRYIYRPTRARLAELYACCDLFVSASWWESFGLPPLEAMACGAPVVLTDSRGVRDYARPGENCIMVPACDPQALARAIERVLTDKVLARRLSHNGPPTAQRFDWHSAVDRFEESLYNLLSESR